MNAAKFYVESISVKYGGIVAAPAAKASAFINSSDRTTEQTIQNFDVLLSISMRLH